MHKFWCLNYQNDLLIFCCNDHRQHCTEIDQQNTVTACIAESDTSDVDFDEWNYENQERSQSMKKV